MNNRIGGIDDNANCRNDLSPNPGGFVAQMKLTEDALRICHSVMVQIFSATKPHSSFTPESIAFQTNFKCSSKDNITTLKVQVIFSNLLNSSLADLDMELYDSDGDLFDRSDSSIDNVEQVKLEEGLDVSVYIRVHCWVSSGSESFGLAPPSSFQSVPPPPWWPSSAPAKFPLVDKKALQSEKKVFALYRNYPNPFNPETWIPFQLASEADVVIRIYNIEGQLVRTISLGNQLEGIYVTKDKSAFWNGKNDEGNLVSSGVYFYTLFANGKKIGTRKVIMLK